MSIEAALAELTAAVRENTAAHTKLAEVAAAAQKASTRDSAATEHKTEKKAEPKAAPKNDEAKAEKKTDPKATGKAAAKTKKAAPPVLDNEVSEDDLKVQARNYMSGDDEDEREAKKANVSAAFNHLGVKKLSELEDDAERARLAGYIAYWAAGLAVDFEEIDALVAAASSDEGEDDEDEDDDDMLE